MSAPPVWATDLLAQVWTHYTDSTPPELCWRRSRRIGSSGRAWPRRRIVVTAGTDRNDARIVLLHEVAHCLVGPGHHHDGSFWVMAWLVFTRYHGPVPLARILAREAGYRTTSTDVAAYLGVPGAQSLRDNAPTGKWARRWYLASVAHSATRNGPSGPQTQPVASTSTWATTHAAGDVDNLPKIGS